MTEYDGEMKNHRKYIIPYSEGAKTLTARLSGEYDLSRGDTVALTTPDNEQFGEATVSAAIKGLRISDFVAIGFKGHDTYETVEEAVEVFSQFWDNVDESTLLDVFKFKDIIVYEEFIQEELGIETIESQCPECGSYNVVYQEGCEICRDCGAMECTGDRAAANT